MSFNGNNVVNRGSAVTPEICNLREQHASLYRRREGGEKIWVKDKHQTLPWPTPTSGWRTRTHLSWQIVTIAASQTISDLTMPPCIPRNLRRINRSVGQKKHGRNEHCQQLQKGKIPKDFTFQQQHDWGHVWLDNCKYIQCFTVANCSLQTIDIEHYTGSLAQNKASILTKRTPQPTCVSLRRIARCGPAQSGQMMRCTGSIPSTVKQRAPVSEFEKCKNVSRDSRKTTNRHRYRTVSQSSVSLWSIGIRRFAFWLKSEIALLFYNTLSFYVATAHSVFQIESSWSHFHVTLDPLRQWSH